MPQKYDIWSFSLPGMGDDIVSAQKRKLNFFERRILQIEKNHADETNIERMNSYYRNVFRFQNSTADLLLKPDLSILNHVGIYCEVLQGVASYHINPVLMNENGKIAKRHFKLFNKMQTYNARLKGFVAGSGEKQNIAYGMKLLSDAEKNDLLPQRVVLSGFSRGASAAIAFAKAIYLKYGQQIKVALHIIDPVPGPGRHHKSKMVIPPNVDSMLIFYANNEKSKIFLLPQHLGEIYFRSDKTTVTTATFPVDHLGRPAKGFTQDLFDDTIRHSCHWAWCAFTDLRSTAKIEKVCDPRVKAVGIRKKWDFVIATDPADNENLSVHLKNFHNQLQRSIYTLPDNELEEFRGRTRLQYITETTRILSEDTPLERVRLLKAIYAAGKIAKKIPLSQLLASGNRDRYSESTFDIMRALKVSKISKNSSMAKMENGAAIPHKIEQPKVKSPIQSIESKAEVYSSSLSP